MRASDETDERHDALARLSAADAALARALGIAPRLRLDLAAMDLSLAVWRQRDREYEIPPLADPIVSIHVGGRGRVRFGDRDGWSRRSSTPGTVTFLPAGTATRWLVEDGEAQHLSIITGVHSPLRTVVTGAAHCIEVGLPDALNVSLAQALVDALDHQGDVDAPYIRSLCETLLLHFARVRRMRYRVAQPELGCEIAECAVRAIEARYAEALSVRELAAGAGLSAAHFSELFKRATGRSPHQYLLQVRIERVREALRLTDVPLGEIAQNFGFSSQSHLNTAFRKWMGITPAQYRGKHRG